MSEFKLRQNHIANRLGIPEDQVRANRHRLKEGVDWIKKGNTLLFAESALKKVSAAVELEMSPKLLAWPQEHYLVVAKIWSNFRYVGALVRQERPNPNGGVNEVGFAPVPECGPLLRVRVRTNVNLVRGMVLRCIHLGSDLYEAMELPRRKGRW